MAASHVAMSWGKVNEQLYDDILKEETLPYCIDCHTYGHLTLGCPTRSKPVQPFRPFSSLTTTPSPDTFGTASNTPLSSRTKHLQQAAICRDFNCRTWVAPIVSLSISATNQTAEKTTLALSALKYPNCNSTPPILNPPSTPVNITNLSTELKHHPDQQFIRSFLQAPSNGTVMLAIPALALLA